MLVRLLGPVDVLADGVARPAGGLRRKAVLAMLGLAAGEVVGTGRLLDVAWEGRSSAVGLNALQTHISHLRRVLGGSAAIVARGSGYALDLGAEATDVQVAVRLIEQGRRETRPERRVARLRAALELWRGRPLSDVAGLSWLDAQADRLDASRVETVLELAGVRLDLGDHAALVPELAELSQQHPYREDVCRQLMLALYRAGRQGEALSVFRELRGRLAEDLGIDPGGGLRDLEAAILRQDRALDPPAQRVTVPISADAAGAEKQQRAVGLAAMAFPLPADPVVLVGRSRECDSLIAAAEAVLDRGGGQAEPAAAVRVVYGMPGVGKTALVVRVAHRLAGRFARRPLFVDLCGYTNGRDPVDPAQVLAGLLVADGIDPRNLPEGLSELSALWRERTAGHPLLMVLDDAVSTGQVVPLLPAAGSVVLISSRRFLGDLPGGAVVTPLEVLEPEAAARLFTRLAPRAQGDPGSVADLMGLCGYLPLAVGVLARALVRHATWSMPDLVAETRTRLTSITAENRTVGAAFELSYRHLPAGRQEFFRLLALHPGGDLDAYAAAALAGVPHTEALEHLDGLHVDNLIVEIGYHRYTMHDLLRGYARAQAVGDPPERRRAALVRLVDFYQHTAAAANARLARRTRSDPTPAAPVTGAPDLVDTTGALAWLRVERDNLLACLDATDNPRQRIEVATSLSEVLRCDGPWTQAITLHEAAAATAERLDDAWAKANALTDLAVMYRHSGDYKAAEQNGQHALDAYRDLGDPLGTANALTVLGDIWFMGGDYPAAGRALAQALDTYTQIGDRLGRATAGTILGFTHYMLDDYAAAERSLREAVGLSRELGHRLGEARALHILGEVLRAGGNFPAAAATLRQALDAHIGLGDRLGQAHTFNFLGKLYNQTGEERAAGQALHAALELYGDLGDVIGKANALHALAQYLLNTGECSRALSAARAALALYCERNHALGQANALKRIGVIRVACGEHNDGEAIDDLSASLDIYRRLGDRSGEAEVLNELGTLHRVTGALAEARRHHRQALDLATQIHSEHDSAHAWAGLGRCDLAEDDTAGAVEHLGVALAIFERIGAAETTAVGGELDAVTLQLGSSHCRA